MSTDAHKPSESKTYRNSRLQVTTQTYQYLKMYADYTGDDPDAAGEKLILKALQAEKIDLPNLSNIYRNHQKAYKTEVDRMISRMRGHSAHPDDEIPMQ